MKLEQKAATEELLRSKARRQLSCLQAEGLLASLVGIELLAVELDVELDVELKVGVGLLRNVGCGPCPLYL